MKLIKSSAEYCDYRRTITDKSVGFVPTMGALHHGHASLLERSVKDNDLSVLSIYVNPTQFNNPNDLNNYPVTLDADLTLAESLGVDVVFMPDYDQMYPDGFRFLVDETEFSQELCGKHRPGHFTGVMTVVMKLLNIVQPHRAYFGEKDFQQLSLIKDMVAAFFMQVEIIGVETVREADGLASSSRNLNLTESERQQAPLLRQALLSDGGDEEVAKALGSQGFDVDYVQTKGTRRFAAASLGSVRLIDNVGLNK